MRKGTLIKILVCFLVVVGLGTIWYFNNKEYTVIVTTPDGKEIEIPDDFDSDLGKQFIIDMGVEEYKEYKKGFKQLDIEYNTEFGDRYVTRGTEYNFTVPTYLKNKWGDAISDFDIKTNTVVTGLASQGNDVYVFLKVLSKVIQKEPNPTGANNFKGYLIRSLLCYEDVDPKIVEDLFSGDEFKTFAMLRLIDENLTPKEIAKVFTNSTPLSFKDFFGGGNNDGLVATAGNNEDGEMTKWYALIEGPSQYGKGIQLYYGYMDVDKQELKINQNSESLKYDGMWVAPVKINKLQGASLKNVGIIEIDNCYVYVPARKVQSLRPEEEMDKFMTKE